MESSIQFPFGGEMREFLRCHCSQGDLRIVSAEGEVTRAHTFFLLGNLPELSPLVEICDSCQDRAGQTLTFIIPDISQAEVERAVDQLYLKGEVRPFQRIFGVEEQEERREPVIIPFTLRNDSSMCEDTKLEVDPKQEVEAEEEDEEQGDNNWSEGLEDFEEDFEEEGPKKKEKQKVGKKAICFVCGKGFRDNYLLRRHMKVHDNVKKNEGKVKETGPRELLTCPDCSYKTMSKDLLKRHWRHLHDSSRYKIVSCKICSYSTRRTGDLRRHFRKVHKMTDVSPEDYGEEVEQNMTTFDEQKITTFDKIKKHYGENFESRIECEEIDSVTFFKCYECDYKFNKKYRLLRHIDDRHINPFQHMCHECGKSFAEKKFLTEHEKRIHLNESLACDVCGFRERNAHLIRIHKMMKHEGYVQPCPYCDNHYSDKAGCRKHIKKKHQGLPVNLPELRQLESEKEKKTYTCRADSDKLVFNGVCLFEECGLEFRTIQRLLAHQNEVHGDTKLTCQHIGCNFVGSQAELRAHMKKIHEKKRQHEVSKEAFYCDQCSFTSKNRTQLRDHIEAIHEGVRYTCQTCGHIAPSKAMLKRHIKLKHEALGESSHSSYPAGTVHSMLSSTLLPFDQI